MPGAPSSFLLLVLESGLFLRFRLYTGHLSNIRVGGVNYWQRHSQPQPLGFATTQRLRQAKLAILLIGEYDRGSPSPQNFKD